MNEVIEHILAECQAIGCNLTAKDGNPAISAPKEARFRGRFQKLLALAKANRGAILQHFGFCPLCKRECRSQEDRDHAATIEGCQQYGNSKAVTDGHGRYHPIEPRCPFKENP